MLACPGVSLSSPNATSSYVPTPLLPPLPPQTGFGRTGAHFWGFQLQGVTPDIVTMAKGMGNGAALGAVVTTPAIAASLRQRLHFNTFGGNPPAMAAGRAVLRVLQQERRQARLDTPRYDTTR